MFCSYRYGESEVFFSFIKASAVVIFIIVAICINLGASPANIVFGTTTWRDPGATFNGFSGYCATFTTAAFAFAGTELMGLAANETECPRKIIPMATKQIAFRIACFYIISLLVVGFIVPYTNPQLLSANNPVDTSPFVIACQLGGIVIFK